LNSNDNALDKMRADLQSLHESLSATSTEDRASAHARLRAARGDAQRLAASLKEQSQKQDADVRQHLQKAAVSLEDAVVQAKDQAATDESEIKAANAAMFARVSEAVRHVSQAVAAKRASAAKLVRS